MSTPPAKQTEVGLKLVSAPKSTINIGLDDVPVTIPGVSQDDWDKHTPQFQLDCKVALDQSKYTREDEVVAAYRLYVDQARRSGKSIFITVPTGPGATGPATTGPVLLVDPEIMAAPADADEDKYRKEMFEKLEELNGLESYRPEEIADDELSATDFMLIPEMLLDKVVTDQTDRIGIDKRLRTVEIMYIAAVNAEALRAANHVDAVAIGIIRARIAARSFATEAYNVPAQNGDILKGRHTFRGEIMVTNKKPKGWNSKKLAASTDISLEVINAFMGADAKNYSMLATLLPVFAAIQFQKTNHHYPKSEDARLAYKKHFESCVLANLEERFNKQDLIYMAVHWLGPYNGEMWKTNLAKIGKMPRGMRIKMAPTPAGTALILTQLQVWDAISVFPGARKLLEYYEPDLKYLREAKTVIEEDRLSFHVFSRLFNKTSRLEEPLVVSAAKAAARIAAIPQAFIESVAQKTDLARVRALKKHSDNNIALFQIASAGFSGALRRIRRDANTVSLSEAILPASQRAEAVPRYRREIEPATDVAEANP